MATTSKYGDYVETVPPPPPTSESSPPPPGESSPPPPGGSPPTQRKQWKLPRRWRLFALIALIILLVGGSATFLISWLPGVLPAATATVTITPTSQQLYEIYDIEAVTGTPDAERHQVAARTHLLSYTTPEKSLTVAATGQGSTQATGTLIFSQATTDMTIFGGQGFSGASGVGLVIDTAVDIWSGQTVAVTAHADVPGPGGNVPADDVNKTVTIYDYTQTPIGTVHVENTAPFTGGKDNAYSFVQQSDIDDATDELVSQLTSDAQAALQQQLRANEGFANNGVQCTPRTKANHQANDRASDVTVTGSVTCKGEAYDLQTARSMAADWLRSDAASQLGAHYALVGDIQIGTPQVSTPDEHGTVTMIVIAEGVWVYQFSEAQKQTFAQLIAWKPLADAQAFLLKQAGVKKVSITTYGGWGSALPTSPNDIKFSMVAVPGLQATP